MWNIVRHVLAGAWARARGTAQTEHHLNFMNIYRELMDGADEPRLSASATFHRQDDARACVRTLPPLTSLAYQTAGP